MLGIERRRKTMELLQQNSKVYVNKLSELFSVTEETVRRDLEKLEKEGLIRRSYGGAVLKENTHDDISFMKRKTIHLDLKQAIGRKTADLIKDNETLMIDPSTTCGELMKFLRRNTGLSLITNSVKLVCDYANSGYEIISSGGALRDQSFALTGPTALSSLSNYFVDKAILSCKGISMEAGVTESNEAESEVKKQMVRQANQVLLLVDSSKFDKIGFTKMLDFEKIDFLITDKKPSDAWIDFLTEKGITLLY